MAMKSFAPEAPSKKYVRTPLVIACALMAVYAVAVFTGFWIIAAIAVGFGLGHAVGSRTGWRAAWGCWERPYARLMSEYAEQVLATAPDELSDEGRKSMRELQEYATERLDKTRNW